MRGRIVAFMSVLFAGSLLIWTFGGVSESKAKEPDRLIDSIEGPALYKAYCAVCHGADARGNGPMAPAMKVAPPDLTRIAERNGGAYPMKLVTRIITGEETLPSGHGSRGMPVWGTVFSQVDRDVDMGNVRIDNLTRYLKSLQTAAAAYAR